MSSQRYYNINIRFIEHAQHILFIEHAQHIVALRAVVAHIFAPIPICFVIS